MFRRKGMQNPCGELGMYKGALYENIIADAFSKSGRSLFYYHKDSGLEIDFITPIELAPEL